MKNTIVLISAIILLLLVVIFTLQNTQAIHVDIFLWGFQSSLALILFTTFAAGFLLGLLALLPKVFRTSSDNKKKPLNTNSK